MEHKGKSSEEEGLLWSELRLGLGQKRARLARKGSLHFKPGRNELRLPLRADLDSIPVFRRSIKTFHGYEVSPDQPLRYSTLLSWIKDLGAITGFQQVARP